MFIGQEPNLRPVTDLRRLDGRRYVAEPKFDRQRAPVDVAAPRTVAAHDIVVLVQRDASRADPEHPPRWSTAGASWCCPDTTCAGHAPLRSAGRHDSC